MSATELLNHLDALHAAATPRPWCVHHGMTVRAPGGDPRPVAVMGRYTDGLHDAALIVAAVNALPRLTAALRAVMGLADDMDRELRERGIRLDRCSPPGDRIRSTVTAALVTETGR